MTIQRLLDLSLWGIFLCVSGARALAQEPATKVVPDPWTDEEAEARWQKDAPAKVIEDSELRIVRTDHYIVLTNLGKGQTAKSFGKIMDGFYEQIRSVYPFEEKAGERLLPIFYFIQSEQYYGFCVKAFGWTMEQARRSKGVASRDFYATYHEAPNDPTHLHEATHQIFGNRLDLSGGGSWFQEGVAEYMSENPNDLNVVENLVKKGRQVPLAKFMQIESLLMSASEKSVTGENEGSNNYRQAAAIIEFAAESEWAGAKFYDFLHAVGSVDRGDVPAIEAALQKVYGTGIDGFEEKFVEYWSNRKKMKGKFERKH
jgi:hypothetical protein